MIKKFTNQYFLIILIKNKEIFMNTENCLDFLITELISKAKISYTDKADWVCLKKYKNYLGQTCRDFINDKKNLKMIVVHDKEKNTLSLIENQNFIYFLKNQAVQPLFCYVAFSKEDSFNFLFCLYKDLIEKDSLNMGGIKVIEILISKLKTIFQERNIQYNETHKMIVIKGFSIDYIMEKLEQNNFKFEPYIFEKYEGDEYSPIYPDMTQLKYQFPEDEKKNATQALNTVFLILSKQLFNEEIEVRIKKLLKKIPSQELKLSQKIAMDLNLEHKDIVKSLFEYAIEHNSYHLSSF